MMGCGAKDGCPCSLCGATTGNGPRWAEPVALGNGLDALECNHCGNVAIWSDMFGMFRDGDGDGCISCGYPGHVSADEETDAYWWSSDDPNDRCTQADCEECNAD